MRWVSRGPTPWVHQPMRTVAVALLLGFALPFCLVSTGAGEPPLPAAPRITVPKGAALPETMRAAAKLGFRVALAERPYQMRSLAHSLAGASSDESLNAIAESFDLSWLARSRTIVFGRRCTAADEPLDLEVEELRAVTQDLYRLIHRFAPYPLDEQYTRSQNRFYASLSGQTLRTMREPAGLPFGELPPEQQAEWRLLSYANAFCDKDLVAERAARIYREWRRTALSYRTNEQGGRALWFSYPDAGGRADGRRFSLPAPREDVADLGPAGGSGAQVTVEPAKLTPSYSCPVTLPDGEMTVRKLVGVLAQATRNSIEVPTWAQDRPVVVVARDANGADVVNALQDLYGWELRLQSGRRWNLGRPVLSDTADVRGLYSRLKRALPPSIHRFWQAKMRSVRLYQAGYRFQFTRILSAITQALQEDWRTAASRDLPPAVQRQLANLVFVESLKGALDRCIEQPEPQWYLVAPERGLFFLEGTDSNPMLMFRVLRPDGRRDGWGWVVGSSTIKD